MLYLSPYITAYILCVTILLGLAMGSFLNCWAWRITHGESILHGRSHCTSCGHALSARDLVPLFSWLATKGKCRYCGEKVPWRYPATELLCAAVYASIVLRYDVTPEAAELVAFASVLLVLSLTDLDDYLIPNGCIIAAIAIRVAYIASAAMVAGADALQLTLDSLIGGVVILVPMVLLVLVTDRLLGKPSMGGGDLKLFCVAGLYFGWEQCLLLVIIACVLGIATAFAGARSSGATGGLRREIPFGPSIAIACWIVMLCGPGIVSWYAGLF